MDGHELGDYQESRCQKMPVKGKSLGHPGLFHDSKTDRIGIAEALVLVLPWDILGFFFKGLVRIDSVDTRACSKVLQKCHGGLIAERATDQDVGLSNNEIRREETMVLAQQFWIDLYGLIVILIRFIGQGKPRPGVHK